MGTWVMDVTAVVDELGDFVYLVGSVSIAVVLVTVGLRIYLWLRSGI